MLLYSKQSKNTCKPAQNLNKRQKNIASSVQNNREPACAFSNHNKQVIEVNNMKN